MRNVAAVGLIPGLVLLDVREAAHEFLHVVLVLRDARQPHRAVLGVVEGDEYLLVLRFGCTNEARGELQRVGVRDRVVGRDVAHDLGVQLAPQRVVEHLRLLIADARQVGGSCVRAWPRGTRGGGDRGERTEREHERDRKQRAGMGAC